MEDKEKRVLIVGLACVDIVNVCADYPLEDSDQRTLDYYWQRGGNAANTSTVVALLGEQAEYLGVLADDHEMSFLKADFASYGVCTDNCVIKKDCQTSTSIIILNQKNGSRTILHSEKKLPELSFDEFRRVELSNYKWVHFEGRKNHEEMKKMLKHVDDYNLLQTRENRVCTSLELEKPYRLELDPLRDQADFIFVSKEYCMSHHYSIKEEAVDAIIHKCRKGSTVICPWGDQGAVAKTRDGQMVVSSPAFPPDKLIDTLGAGDTFVAATIVALSKGRSIQDSIKLGCQVAGAKCGMIGNKGLKKMDFN